MSMIRKNHAVNCDKVTLGNAFAGEDIDIVNSDPTKKVTINGLDPNVSLDLSQDYTGNNNHTGNLNYEGDNTHSGMNTYTGESVFGNNQGSGGVGMSTFFGQVRFEDSSQSGDAGEKSKTLCRTSTNKLTSYDLLGSDLAFTGNNTNSGVLLSTGSNTHTGTTTFGNDGGSGGVGKTIHYGQVFFEDSSISGDAAVSTETLCRTATNKLKTYDPDGVSHAWTGTNTHTGTSTFGTTGVGGGEGQAIHFGQLWLEDSCLSGDAGLPAETICRTATNKATSYDLLGDDFSFTGDHTHSGTIKMSALTASLHLALDGDKNIITTAAGGGVALDDDNAWTGTNSYSETSTHTNDIIMTTGNLDVEDGDLDVMVGTVMVSSGNFNVAANTAPASASAQGEAGTVIFTADYIYYATATDTWKRTALSTW